MKYNQSSNYSISDIFPSDYDKQLKDSKGLTSEIYSNGSKKVLTCSK